MGYLESMLEETWAFGLSWERPGGSMCGKVAPAAARMRVMESPDFLLPFGHADTERLVTKRKQGIWLFSLMSRILMKIDGFMPWRASGVS